MKQHYIPKTYLRFFEVQSKPGFVWLYGRGIEPALVNIEKVAKESDIYTFFGPGGRPTTEVEEVFARLEGAVTPILKRINQESGPLELAERERDVLSLFAAYQLMRTKAMQRAMREIITNVVRDIGDALCHPAPVARDAKDDIALEKGSMIAALEKAPGISSILLTKRLEVLRSTEEDFITSDYPATRVDPPEGASIPDFFEIFLPVGRKAALLWVHDSKEAPRHMKGSISCRFLKPSNVQAINNTTIAIAERFVFASYKSDEIRARLDRTSPRARSTVREFQMPFSRFKRFVEPISRD